jgi:hypothetical protein
MEDSDLAAEGRRHPFVTGTLRALEKERDKHLNTLIGKVKTSSDPEVRGAGECLLRTEELIHHLGGTPTFARREKKK